MSDTELKTVEPAGAKVESDVISKPIINGHDLLITDPAPDTTSKVDPNRVDHVQQNSLGLDVTTTTTPEIKPTTANPSSDTSPPASDAVPIPATTIPKPPTSSQLPLSPAPRRPLPPTKGILKPPPPPAKPTLTNRLRDIVTVVGGGARTLFEPLDSEPPTSTPGAGPSTLSGGSVGGAIGALSGRLGLGFSRLVNGSPTSSPVKRNVALPGEGLPGQNMEGGGSAGEKERQVVVVQSGKKRSLKRATFVLPSLSITYPISSQGEPWSQKVLDDRKKIESTHRDLLVTTTGAEYWTSQRLVALYENASRIREERPRIGIVRALEVLPPHPKPRHIHLVLRPPDFFTSSPSNTLDTPLNRHSAESIADVLAAEWSLVDLRLEGGVVDSEEALKPILHALLVSGTLPSLSLAGNKKIRAGGWRLVAVFLKRARSLRFIDLSDTTWDKKSVDYLVQALTSGRIKTASTSANGHDISDISNVKVHLEGKGISEEIVDEKNPERISAYGSFIPPAPFLREDDESDRTAAVQTLRMDGCGLRTAVLESLAQGVRSSDVKNISLRRNRIGPLGAVALALMMRDYPDSAGTMSSISPSLATPSTPATSQIPTATSQTPKPQTNGSSSYTPYIARTRRPINTADTSDPQLPPIPLVTSSPAGGVTSRILPDGYKPPMSPRHALFASSDGVGGSTPSVTNTNAEGKLSMGELGGASVALQRSVRALEGVERIGRLLTLDLKGNEIKNGVGYIAQVLKRNRTLKVLNLSDNRIEPAGLAALAEALKYNSSLETLDMSSNPCCGPSLEGVSALRTAFTLNTSLKRLFLADTSLTTDSAISLAEFLPESRSILHLDLTLNPQIEIAGILALSVGLRSNSLIRCLDISIPPNTPDLAELSQNILQLCIRNTELAAAGQTKGKEAIWGPIKKSNLVRIVKEAEEARGEKERLEVVSSPEGQAREYVYKLKPGRELLGVIEGCVRDLGRWFQAGIIAGAKGFVAWEPGQLPGDDFELLYVRIRILRERLVEMIQASSGDTGGDGNVDLDKLLSLNDEVGGVIERGKTFSPPPRLLLPSQISLAPVSTTNTKTKGELSIPKAINPHARRHMRVPSHEISSPNFSIGDSDGDSDAEELELGLEGGDIPGSRGVEVEGGKPDADGLGVGLKVEEKLGERSEEKLGERGGGGAVEEEEEETVFSPVERISRAWVEEEGEIFRKGTKLGVVDDGEVEEHGDVSGEQLKQEILDTPVARSPTRRVIAVEGEEEIEGLQPSSDDRA